MRRALCRSEGGELLRKACLLCTLFACCCLSVVRADEVRLLNGDRVSGEVLRIESGKLFVKTSYAPEVAIDIKQVSTLQTDEPVFVTIDQNSTLRAVLRADRDGRVALVADGWLETEPVALERLTALTRKPEPPVRVAGRINFGSSTTSGNTETSKLHMDAELIARSVVNRVTFGGAANRTQDGGVTTESNWLGYLKYDHFLSKQWYVYGNGTAERDRFKDIRLRTTLGAGTGYQFVETPKTNLALEGGANYVNTDSYVAEDEAFPAVRVALRFDHLILRDRLQFFHQSELYSDTQGSDNTFVRTLTGLRMPVFFRVTATLQYNVDWEADPAPDRVPTDRALLFTLGYVW
jgi:putative salt-induced outer membrane protein YdiY